MDDERAKELLKRIAAFSKDVTALDLQDTSLRQELLDCSRRLTASLESPKDTVLLRANDIKLDICVRACIDLGVFKLLASRSDPIEASDLAAMLGAEPQLTIRFMRGVCALGFAREDGCNVYGANAMTYALAQPPTEAGYSLLYDNATRSKSNLSETREHLRENGYKSPQSVLDGPYQKTNDCVGTSTFDQWSTMSGELSRFNTSTHAVRSGRPAWVEWFPETQIFLQDSSLAEEDEVLVVDVGGGHRHDLQAFAERYPNAKGRLIVQDLPYVIDEIDSSSLDPRIELQRHDMFTPQPVQGAQVYFMHMIMPDWPDQDCVQILQHICAAMKKDHSVLLISDAISADMNATLRDTTLNITMMAHHSGLERSEQMWKNLIRSVGGLEILNFWRSPTGEGIVQIKRK